MVSHQPDKTDLPGDDDHHSPDAQKASGLPGSILFVCGMNVIRSPIAEALARALLPSGIYIASAGVKRGERDAFVDAVLDEEGLSLGRRQPQTLEDLEDDYFDLVVTLSPEAHHAALELTRASAVEVVYWPTPDPTGTTGTRAQILDAYRDVRDRLKRHITDGFVSP
ncbi:arsenate-mycothiol transferase ArsC [Rhizobium sp. SL42]|uniref:arsenate-mycothiol transferase ArsC n=1 Tax=Rhizobium sp. SL42 TaxID=2806346 RepID=UPI001F435D8F|nr:low molecular weight phosphatase family protein [Rhizobium sp. SL42]UJW76020.1 low molecular weight phosphatase family protein [Rhizobium sp. SL42]